MSASAVINIMTILSISLDIAWTLVMRIYAVGVETPECADCSVLHKNFRLMQLTRTAAVHAVAIMILFTS